MKVFILGAAIGLICSLISFYLTVFVATFVFGMLTGAVCDDYRQEKVPAAPTKRHTLTDEDWSA